MLAVVMAVACLSLASCNNSTNNDATTKTTAADESDFSYVSNKGELVIGVTEFKPMNYKDDKGEWTGFETEFAQAVCEGLGVKAKFQIIDWDSKVTELQSKNIDVIWNGMTVTEELGKSIDFSKSYIKNMQVVVISKANAAKFKSVKDLETANLVCEKGSAGEKAIKEDASLSKATTTPVGKQADALLEVKSGTADAAVLDYVMAKKMVGDGSDYSDLQMIDGVELSSEEYAVGIRKGSDLKAKIDEQIDALIKNGKLNEIAEKYDLKDSLLSNQ